MSFASEDELAGFCRDDWLPMVTGETVAES